MLFLVIYPPKLILWATHQKASFGNRLQNHGYAIAQINDFILPIPSCCGRLSRYRCVSYGLLLHLLHSSLRFVGIV